MSVWLRAFWKAVMSMRFVAMTEMIELARNFELQTKVMKNVDENSGASAKLMQMA